MRMARPEDVEHIVPWTTDTFDWGDYVPDRLPAWIEDPSSAVVVCLDESEIPVALAHALLLSKTEAWLEAARVHPDYKRSGMGSAMNHAGVAWARERGAKVVRLATEADNEAARRQVEALDYRQTSNWVHARYEIGPGSAKPGKPGLRPAPPSDVDAAWMFWSTSNLAHDSRGLIAHGWRWRKATPGDLATAAGEGNFYQSPAGWVVADAPEEDRIRTLWLATTPEEAPWLLADLIDLASQKEATELTIMMPNIPWVAEALSRSGAESKEVVVYSLAL
ncbi:MAG: GNAT family N-acetyltransferase [Acidobacteria bacterium]|nr:GNAT family N-acetyltransferase [Acidobacteriota bacterium]